MVVRSEKLLMRGNGMKYRRRNIVILLACLLLFVIVWIVAISPMNKNELLYIGEMGTSKEELVFSIDDVKGTVKNKLQSEYKSNAEEFEWDNMFGEKTGHEYLKEETLLHLKYIKVKQQESIKAKIIERFSYSYFLDMLETENTQRKQAISNGQTVFGPEQYSEKQYYKYFNNNIEIQLKKYLIEQAKISISDKEIEKYYLENKDYFLNKDLAEVKESVTLFGQDIKYQEYIDELAGSIEIKCNDEEILDIIKSQVK